MLRDGDFFISAGQDGYIKWWKQDLVDSAEAEEGLDFAMQPVKELQIVAGPEGKDPAYIIEMVSGPKGSWYVQDRNGYMHVLDEATGEHRTL